MNDRTIEKKLFAVWFELNTQSTGRVEAWGGLSEFRNMMIQILKCLTDLNDYLKAFDLLLLSTIH